MSIKELDARLQKALAKGRPAQVSRIVTRRGTDSTGDPAVWLWLILKDDAAREAGDRTELDDARRWAETTARTALGDHWVYVSFRKESEQKELESKK